MRAVVYKSTGSRYVVKTSEGIFQSVRLKGKFKIDAITSTNPIAVGDVVEIANEDDFESTIITDIFERRNYINRVSPHNKNQHHIVASNLDQSLLFATIKDPKTSLGFIDRFLITSEAYQVPAIIVFNKVDVLKERDVIYLDYVKSIYEQIGYRILTISLKDKIGINNLADILQNKVTLLSGHSGVGKSTFINFLFPELQLKTQDVSEWSGKGMHTTTFAEMFDLPNGGQIIDTPGIREMGLVNMNKNELAHFYPEMRLIMNDCQFNNCVHMNEPGCAIKLAVENKKIAQERYLSYLNIIESLSSKNY